MLSSYSHSLRSANRNAHPFRLRRIALRHFKSADCVDVALRPLSAIVGANSSGKSSLLQALALTAQTIRVKAHDTFILNGELVRMGRYADVLNLQHSESGEPIMIGFRLRVPGKSTSDTDTAIEEYALDAAVFLTESESGKYNSRIEGGSICISIDSISKEVALWTPVHVPLDARVVENIIRYHEQQDKKLDRIKGLSRHNTFRIKFAVLDSDPIHASLSELHSFWGLNPPKPGENVANRSDESDIASTEVKDEDSLFSRLVTPAHPDSWSLTGVDNLSGDFFSSRVHYLGPLRSSPTDSRPVGFPSGVGNVGTQGEHTAAVLRNRSDEWASLPMPDGHERFAPIGEALNGWLHWFGLAEAAETREVGRSGPDIAVSPFGVLPFVDLSSVGVGVSQVLPVIMLCLLSTPSDLLVLEHPELHLHPALQKRMADFLLVFVRAGRQILVETHSDHLVNQLRYQVAADQTDEIKDLVKLIFAEQTDGITTYRESEINEYGGLSEDWPDGFLDISARSAQELVRHGLRKWKLRKPEPGEAN